MNSEIKQFDSTFVSRFDGFYLLSHISPDDGPIEIVLQTINGIIPSSVSHDFALTDDGRIIVCFSASFFNLKFNNLIAQAGGKSEVINLQLFERLRRYYKLDGRNDSKSHFFFYNSIPVVNTEDLESFNIDLRCHVNLLGPETFMKNDAPVVPLVDYNHIYVYEPILSVNGVAHFGYTQTNTDIQWYSNEDPFPRITFTMQEGLRQILDWADSSLAPWNNNETISIKANELFNALHFSDEEKNHIRSTQPDMQISKYLKGDAEARQRPDTPGLLDSAIESSILKRLSHMSILNFINVHNIPISKEMLNECVSIQNRIYANAVNRVVSLSGLDVEQLNEENVDLVKREIFKKGRVYTSEAIMADALVSLSMLNQKMQ